MRACLWLLLPIACAAQPPVVRGVLVDRDAQAGEFTVRAAEDRVYRYQFDRKTYIERDDQMIDMGKLRPGDKLEVVSDDVPGLAWRYARTIHVMHDVPPGRAKSLARLRAYRNSIEERAHSEANLTFSGVVFLLNPRLMKLHTRDGDHVIVLRQDTRYLENGNTVEAAALKVNMRVFVRAAKDLYDQVEAYQVIWGTILDPK